MTMDIHAIESAAQLAWPALIEQSATTGVLRFAAGVSRRANSMNPYLDKAVDCRALCQETEGFFQSHQHPAIVKVLVARSGMVCDFLALDAHLDTAGYGKEGDTIVMGLPLQTLENSAGADPRRAAHRNWCLTSETANDWSLAWHEVRGLPETHQLVHSQIVARIAAPRQLLCVRDANGKALATGFAVNQYGCLGIFGMATRLAHRRIGLSQLLIQQLLLWGKAQGAGFAYLQVETANAAARALYEKSGFRNEYSYWYRVKNFNTQGELS
ncbi:MAG: GNAT family N-acetyltransferase [Gammaproteobacteria bacterium]